MKRKPEYEKIFANNGVNKFLETKILVILRTQRQKKNNPVSN